LGGLDHVPEFALGCARDLDALACASQEFEGPIDWVIPMHTGVMPVCACSGTDDRQSFLYQLVKYE
jgi:hypothetical protein